MTCRSKHCNAFTSYYFQTCDYYLSQRSARPAILILNTTRLVRYAPTVQTKSFVPYIIQHVVNRLKEWRYAPLSLNPGIRRWGVVRTCSDRVTPEEGVPVSTDNRRLSEFLVTKLTWKQRESVLVSRPSVVHNKYIHL